ncbi:hypothetical protein ACFQJ7_10275 [Halovenus rubra]|uniref:Uncharacterized protein n=2 Tax=Halovenus rubra TaxID=869890 RepID=A0ACC7DVH6_9EURY|nr:hypothetical protein [Halovenus rubra]
MVDITILELNLSDSSFSASSQFGGSGEDGESEESTGLFNRDTDNEAAGSTSGRKTKALAVVATFLFFGIVAAVVKRLSGDDEHEVEIETPEEPVGVTIDDE